MPLVQSLEILRRRVRNPVFKAVLDDVHERVREAAFAVGGIRGAWGDVLGRLHRIAAGWREERQPGTGDPPLRRLREGRFGVKRKTISALVYPAILLVLSCVVVGIIVLQGRPGVCGLLRRLGADLPASTRILVAVSRVRGHLFRSDVADRRRDRPRVLDVAEAAWEPGPVRPLGAEDPDARDDRAEVRDLAGGADAGDAARRRHSAGECHRCRVAIDPEPVHRARTSRLPRSRCARGGRSRRR